MVSTFVQKSTSRLLTQGSRPVYDGSYVDDETGEWHDTYYVESMSGQGTYAIDVRRHDQAAECTCDGFHFWKTCKHIRLLGLTGMTQLSYS